MSELQRLAEISHCMLMSVPVEVSASKGKDGGGGCQGRLFHP